MTTQEEPLDAIVADAVAGDRGALREVLETIRPFVVRYCRARVGALERSGLSADDVARSERFVDALANREPIDYAGSETVDRELGGLLETWRDDLRDRPLRELCAEQDAVDVLNRGLAQLRRARRRVAMASAAAAAVVGVAAFGAVLGQVEPGDALYGVRTTIFGEPASVRDDKIAVSAEADLDQVEQMIVLGQWDQAHDKLAAVGEHVQTVKDADRKQGLIEKVNRLNAKVVLRSGHPPTTAPAITGGPNPFGG